MATWHFPREMASWIDRMSCLLDKRNAWRLCPMLVGAVFAVGRRTVSSWLRAGGLNKDYKDSLFPVERRPESPNGRRRSEAAPLRPGAA